MPAGGGSSLVKRRAGERKRVCSCERDILMLGTSEYGVAWTVADQADQPSLPLSFAVAATSRFD